MKRIQTIIVVVLATVFCTSTAQADGPLDGIGRGRLLRKWRDDLLGKPQPPKKPAAHGHTKNRKPNIAAQRPHLKAPTPADPATRRAAIENTQTVTRSNRQVAQGFGMDIQRGRDGKYYVTQVYRDGNALKAGIQRGDGLIQLGGTKLASIEQLNEIVKILGPGDQIECRIVHQGKEKDLTLQYGKAKPASAPVVAKQGQSGTDHHTQIHNQRSGNVVSRNARNQSGMSGRYDFVPRASATQYQSVLQDPSRPSHPTHPASYSSRRTDQDSDRDRNDDQSRHSRDYGTSILIGR